jgi:hypothetical protein
MAESTGLVLGVAVEWIAKLMSDQSARGRSLPDCRKMRPPASAGRSGPRDCSDARRTLRRRFCRQAHRIRRFARHVCAGRHARRSGVVPLPACRHRARAVQARIWGRELSGRLGCAVESQPADECCLGRAVNSDLRIWPARHARRADTLRGCRQPLGARRHHRLGDAARAGRPPNIRIWAVGVRPCHARR